MVFVDRRPRESDPWLILKLWCFTVGAALAFVGVYLEKDWIVWTAVGVLLVGFGARFLSRRAEEAGAAGNGSRDDDSSQEVESTEAVDG